MRTLFFLLVMSASVYADQPIAEHLQNISVSIKSLGSTGSGVIVTRLVDGENQNFVITAAHVVDGLRSTREIIDSNGQKKTLVEFKDAEIVKEIIEKGRKVGTTQILAKVIKYSDSENGEDLAILVLRKKITDDSVKFNLSQEIVPLGTRLFNVGSPLGLFGANTMTAGIMSQIGRVLDIGNSHGKLMDQLQLGGQPGVSGSGVFLAEGENAGECIGFITRGASESFNLMVPLRVVKQWAGENNLMWVLDANYAPPSMKEILDMPVETTVSTRYEQKSTEESKEVEQTKQLIYQSN